MNANELTCVFSLLSFQEQKEKKRREDRGRERENKDHTTSGCITGIDDFKSPVTVATVHGMCGCWMDHSVYLWWWLWQLDVCVYFPMNQPSLANGWICQDIQ